MTASFSELLSRLTCLETSVLSALRPYDGPGYPPSVYLLAPADAAALTLLPPALAPCLGDPMHILYIGGTRNTSSRLQRLIGSVRAGTNGLGHSAGQKIKHCLGIDQPSLVDILAVSIYPTDRPKEVEHNLLDAYRRTYGAVPLLNRRLRPAGLDDKSFTNLLRVAETCASQGVPNSDPVLVDEKSAPTDDSLMSVSHGREAGEGPL